MASRAPTLRREEAAGLVVAIAAHAALGLWLALKPPTPAPLPVPERMTVTFSDQVAEQSTAPRPAAEAPPAVAPVLAENPAPAPAPAPEPQVRPAPQPAPPKPTPPQPRTVPPRPVPPQPAPVTRPVPTPRVQPAPAKRPQPIPAPAKPTPAKTAPAKPTATAQAATKPPQTKPAATAKSGGSRLGADFLKGLPGGQTPAAREPAPAAQAIGPAVRSALSGAIARQLKPKWTAPQGAEADQLVTILSWDLNPDGTLAGPPRLVSQAGVTDANRPQAQRHVEQAMRAVRLAAPFDLPPDLYAAWKHVAQFRFDRKLSQ